MYKMPFNGCSGFNIHPIIRNSDNVLVNLEFDVKILTILVTLSQ